MKIASGSLVILFAVGAFIGLIITTVQANYNWDSQYGSQWSLGVKASTIAQKSDYIDKFVAALDSSGLSGTQNTLFWPTPDNNFDENMKALKSLQKRLHDIQGMNENDFAYQSAIQQITAQEQDDNTKVLDELEGAWWKVHYPFLWNPFYNIAIVIGLFILLIVGVAVIAMD